MLLKLEIVTPGSYWYTTIRWTAVWGTSRVKEFSWIRLLAPACLLHTLRRKAAVMKRLAVLLAHHGCELNLCEILDMMDALRVTNVFRRTRFDSAGL